MKELILFYSFSGKTKKYVEELTKSTGADLCEITEVKNRGKLSAYTHGIIQVMRGSKSKINPVNVDFSQYDKIIIAFPVWASHQPPAINSAVDLLPEGKDIELIFVSMSGKSNSEKLVDMIKAKKCNVVSVKDVQMK